MAKRSKGQYNALIILIIAVLMASTQTAVFAATYSVPETTEIALAWDPNDPAPEGYRIYQRLEGQAYDYTQPVWTGTNATGTVYNLEYDTTYYFVVRAFEGTLESGDSNEASFTTPASAPVAYTISATTTGDGAISPAGSVTVTGGTDQTFTVSPNTGSYIEDVLLDGVSIGAVTTHTFAQVAQDHTISAHFAYYPHTISASADTGGSISPSGSVSVIHGGSQGYTITPDSGYKVADVLVDGLSFGSVSSYTFDQVVADHTIHATFVVDSATITATAGSNGTITPSGSVVVSIGGTQTFSISPHSGYKIWDVVVDGVSMGSIDTYTFSNVTAAHAINATFAVESQPPTADAGPDQMVDEGQTVTLSALNSMDLDDGIAAYQWRQTQGLAVTLNTPSEPETTFTTPNVDTSGSALVFELSVTDYSGATDVDSCIVNVTWVNAPPIADAGRDQTVTEGAQVLLDASGSTDSDDGIASYAWKQINGPVVVLSNADTATPSFVAPDVGSAGTTLAFEITVTDVGGLQDTATCLINVTWVNTPPVADAGIDQSAMVGAEVVLDGSKSYDADDVTITSYRWYQTNGAPVELSDATAKSPLFVVPAEAEAGGPLVFELTVTDSGGLQGKDSCQINVQPLGPSLHVSKILLQLKQKGRSIEANAYITILDDAGNLVKEASVTGKWSYNGGAINTVTSTTRGDGVARLDSGKISAKPGASFTLEITGATKDGYTYDPASNEVSIRSISVP